MEKKFDDFCDAWEWLNITPIFWHEELGEQLCTNMFHASLDIQVVKVNPDTDCIEDEEYLNTKTQVWLEAGEPYIDTTWGNTDVQFNFHNINYDCGGDTFEEAIIEMANLVYNYNKEN